MTGQGLLRMRVREIRDEAIDVKVFELVSADGFALPAFSPGSHADVHLPGGLVRQYSLCNGPHDTQVYRFAVKREPASRGGSDAMHERLRAGDVIQLGAPRNNFRLDEGAGHAVLVAGGIGITPLLSMALHLQAQGRSFDLQYFSRSAAHCAWRALLSRTEFLGKVTFHDGLDPEQARACLREVLARRREGAQLYLCGPGPFMDTVEQVAAASWPSGSVHLEYFGAAPAAMSGQGFTLRLARTGGEVVVADGEGIVQALARHGVHVETSCEQGVCGTCLTGVLEGVPDHRDVYLTDEEKAAGDQMCVCVSRASGERLVLDL
jgi:vanillate O-demethylase ferredoxin subunit